MNILFQSAKYSEIICSVPSKFVLKNKIIYRELTINNIQYREKYTINNIQRNKINNIQRNYKYKK